ncbi:MAG TPA: hypothetical protein VGV61_16575, partial [Thermoanaerobaculia bacterium]|nr:hypothetical protein [Thermoanaerobaculia bacterium]
VEAMRPVDTATHPRWQRQGLFRRLTEALVEEVRLGGADLLYNTPNTRSGRGYREMGWSTVGRIPVLLRVPRAGRLVRRLLGRADGRGQAPPLHPRMGDGDEQSFALDGLPSVAELLREDALAPFLAALWPTEQRLHTGRTPDYLAWRYADAPAELGYRALWRFAGDASALVIARPRQRRGLREAAVVEVLAAEGERGTAAAAALLAELARAGADYLVATAAARSSERAALARTGFMKVPAAGRTLMARPLAPAAADATDRRSWRLQLGDLELF